MSRIRFSSTDLSQLSPLNLTDVIKKKPKKTTNQNKTTQRLSDDKNIQY